MHGWGSLIGERPELTILHKPGPASAVRSDQEQSEDSCTDVLKDT